MAKYTYKDIIIDPTSEEAKNCIGKMVYYSDNANACLSNANNDNSCKLLQEIKEDMNLPFFLEKNGMGWGCIILKKEEPQPRYVPFESMEEFVERYGEVKDFAEFNSFEDNLFQCGMWLKTYDNEKPTYRLVSRIEYKGVRISELGFFTWKELLSRGFLFLNDTSCGRLKEA